MQTWLQLKEERIKEKKRKGKDDRTLIISDLTYLPLDLLWSRTDKRRNGNHDGFVDTSYYPLHKFTMSRIVVKLARDCGFFLAYHQVVALHWWLLFRPMESEHYCEFELSLVRVMYLAHLLISFVL